MWALLLPKRPKTLKNRIAANRTMHDYAITKAFGRYTRLELDEAKSKLREDLETSVSGWKQLTVVFNDPNVRYK